eukprot:SAG11_NODE_27282_length_334_cov_1.285106_1_plen_45_part_01
MYAYYSIDSMSHEVREPNHRYLLVARYHGTGMVNLGVLNLVHVDF